MIDATLQAVLDKHPEAAAQFKAEHVIDDADPLYEDLFNYYLDSGEMPIGTAKARDGDPLPWIEKQLARDLNLS